MEHNSTFPIKQNELDMLREEASGYLKSIQWEQGQRAKNKDKDAKDESILLYLSRANNGSGAIDITSVSKTILALKKRLLPDSVALPLRLNQTLYAVQEGLAIGIWIKDSYYDASGLSALNERKGTLDSNGKREFESKMHTATAFMLFSAAYHILHNLKPHASDDLSVMKQKFAGLPEVSFLSPLKGVACNLFYFDKYLGHPDIIKSDKDVIDFTVVYFEAVIDEIQLRKSSLEYTETIEDRTYKLENSELKRQELRRQLDFKNKELTSYALNFIKKNEVVQQLQQTINKVKKSNTVEKGKLVTDLNKIIRRNLSIDKDWEDFSRFFDDVHKGFYSTLKSKHEGLTTNDLKICSLIRLNLNIKETASILAISPESVKTARYRLRKKLELEPQQEIFTYLVQLDQD